jgi:hypothetical protein
MWRVVHGASCPLCKLFMGRAVHGASSHGASCHGVNNHGASFDRASCPEIGFEE